MGRKRWRRPIGEDLAREWYGWSEDGAGGPRGPFESPDGAEAHAVWRVLGRHGCRTMWCTGPEGGSPCVLVATGRCRLVDEADLVVSSLDLGDRRCQDVARAGPRPAHRRDARRGDDSAGFGRGVACRAADVPGQLRSAELEDPP